MRNPQFRVYCHISNRLYDMVDRIEWLLSGRVIRATSVISELEEHNMHNGYNNEEYFTLSQYIGRKDFNKKKIYEGDFCKVVIPCPKIFNSGERVTLLTEVIFSEETCSYKLLWKDEDNEELIDIHSDMKIVVIGNIYVDKSEDFIQAINREINIENILYK